MIIFDDAIAALESIGFDCEVVVREPKDWTPDELKALSALHVLTRKILEASREGIPDDAVIEIDAYAMGMEKILEGLD